MAPRVAAVEEDVAQAMQSLSERATRLDLALDFEMRSLEHAIMWDLAKDRILQEYVDSFKQRCDLLETAARAAAPRQRE